MSLDLSICVEMVYDDEPFEARIDRTAEAGVDAFEFWGWREKDLEAIVDRRDETGIDLAGMIGSGAPLTDPERTAEAVADVEASIETAAEIECPALIITVGQEQAQLGREAQHDAIVEVLRACADSAEDADVTLALEPLNTAVDHPGYYLSSSNEGYEIVEAVDSPNVKLLFDVYHQQITEGNVIANLTEHVDLIGHVHVADVPGRHEPGTGELNYRNVFAALEDAGYDGYVGCEFSPTGDPDEAVQTVQSLL